HVSGCHFGKLTRVFHNNRLRMTTFTIIMELEKRNRKYQNSSKQKSESEQLSDSSSVHRDEGDGESVPEVEESCLGRNNMSCRSTRGFNVNIEVDIMALLLFLAGLATRMYRLEEPRSIV
ncbi:hypothetical protein L9F63_017552, partial [Diploptera punctata]